ncbi:MAG: hypothetical protein IJ053_03585 [Lachnospiraceae bacterium]|nr:hypothetical protein [Lachnospiraceae bacterium]
MMIIVNDKRIRHIALICLTALIFIMFSPQSVKAKDEEIKSMNDFYERLSEQIMAHQVDEYYDVSIHTIGDIMDMNFSQYTTHYNADSPLTSGCYLSYYLDSFQLYYINGRLRVVIDFSYTESEMQEHFTKMNELAASLKCEDDFDTVKAVHDYLVENFRYDNRTVFENHTDIEGFRDRKMVCSGYSLAAYYLLNSAGIPTRVVTGYGGTDAPIEVNHMWNMVELDGNWYNMDITWDDTEQKNISYKYFLKSDKDFMNHTRLNSYAVRYFDVIVSDESYKLPFNMRMGMSATKWGILIAFIAIEVFIFVKKQKKDARMRNIYGQEQNYY